MPYQQHGVLEDLCGYIGYTATCRIEDWFAGCPLFIPVHANPDHPIARVINNQVAYERLIEFADDHLSGVGRVLMLPNDTSREITRRDRMICSMLCLGKGTKEVARIVRLTETQVMKIRRSLEADGLMPLVLKDTQWKPGKRTPQSQLHMQLVFTEHSGEEAGGGS